MKKRSDGRLRTAPLYTTDPRLRYGCAQCGAMAFVACRNYAGAAKATCGGRAPTQDVDEDVDEGATQDVDEDCDRRQYVQGDLFSGGS